MAKNKRLKVVGPADTKLGRPTIMDRALAQKHGTPYVHAAASAIDLDRLREREAGGETWPFAWEVWLTEAYLARFLGGDAHVALLEDMTLAVMELPRPKGDDSPPYGSQLPFAVYAGVAHKQLPAAVGTCFHAWKKPPVDLLEELEPLRKDPHSIAKLAERVLDAEVDPPLVGPVREALARLMEGEGE